MVPALKTRQPQLVIIVVPVSDRPASGGERIRAVVVS
jgi:hypothetical protein